MSDALLEICTQKAVDLARRKTEVPEGALINAAKHASPLRSFKAALQNKIDAGKPALVAEIKKASPSAGLIREDFHPAALARAYESGGAACLSVLTDKHFQGQDNHLKQAREATQLPALRKDFMIDPYQVIEARTLGADCILLIVAITILSDAQLQELEATAVEYGLDVLVEVHNLPELERAMRVLNPSLIGINNRDLKTLKVDLATAESLAKHLPRNILGVCESGIRTPAHIARMRQAGLSCFLVGESLMRQNDVARATLRLLGE